jgi:iron complex outermembrane recepter protein
MRSIVDVPFPISLAMLVTAITFMAQPATAMQSSSTVDDPSPGPRQTGSIVGQVVDAATGEPVANAYVRLREIGRNELSHADGAFHFLQVAARSYTVVAQRIGYAPIERRVTVQPNETTELTLEMIPSAIEVAGIVVTGTGRERGAGEAFRPTTVVGEAELRRRLEASLAATIEHVPGISQQYNGPAAAQPVIRGLGGDRVLVLEDGQRTGDLSTTAADHAVMIDPFTARRVEIVRGPAGLMYGGNALGGVINVVREEVPKTLPETIAGAIGLQAESVSRGYAGGASLLVPHGSLALRAEISGRTAGDTRTPLGPLPETDIASYGGSIGLSRIASWGYLGAAYRHNDLTYGVPGQFQGEVIPGAHPDGVEIETIRHGGRAEIGHVLGFGPIGSFSFDANVVHYKHREIEGRVNGREVVGATFDNLFGSANLLVRHEHELDPIFTEGAFGIYGSARDLRTSGGFTGSRDASVTTLAAYVFEELAADPVRLQVGGRYDWTRLTPNDLTPIRTDTREVPVRERVFGAISASVGALVEPWPGWIVGLSLARAFRTPSVEELFSDGPHLADYSYDIGSPDLEPEIGLGSDLFLRVTRPRLHGEVSVFRNVLSDYIHYVPTGELDPRFRRFPVFEARAADAVFTGMDFGLQWEPIRRVVIEGTAAIVRGTRRDGDDPLPAIPPLNGSLGARYETDGYFASLSWQGAGAQNRVPRPIDSPVADGGTIELERPTPGYDLVNLSLGVRRQIAGRLHTLTLQVDNALDEVWRDHLSRVKEVAPQPGRNIQLLYRVLF